jgi:hypothetical protein
MESLPINRGGNLFIMVAVDYISKLLLAQPVPSCAEAPAISSENRIINRHGVPHHIASDQASDFPSMESRDTLSPFVIPHSLATTEQPQTNCLGGRAEECCRNRQTRAVRSSQCVESSWKTYKKRTAKTNSETSVPSKSCELGPNW